MPKVTDNVKLARMPGGCLQDIDELDVHSVLSQVVNPPRPVPEYLFKFQLGTAKINKESAENKLLETRDPLVSKVESMLKTNVREPELLEPAVNTNLRLPLAP